MMSDNYMYARDILRAQTEAAREPKPQQRQGPDPFAGYMKQIHMQMERVATAGGGSCVISAKMQSTLPTDTLAHYDLTDVQFAEVIERLRTQGFTVSASDQRRCFVSWE